MVLAGAVKEMAKRALSATIAMPPSKRVIFVYHDIADMGSAHYAPDYSTTVSAFRAQIDLLARTFSFVPLDEIVSPVQADAGGRRAAITFDDGFLSVKQEAMPLLAAWGIPFAVFLNRRAVQENHLSYGPAYPHLDKAHTSKVFLDENDVRELSAAGVLIGSHSATHRALADLDDDELAVEVLGNKRYLEELIGKQVTHLALPFGKRQHYDDRALDYCFRIGHHFVYSTNPTFFDPNVLGKGPQLLPRVEISHEPTEKIFFLMNRPLLRPINL